MIHAECRGSKLEKSVREDKTITKSDFKSYPKIFCLTCRQSWYVFGRRIESQFCGRFLCNTQTKDNSLTWCVYFDEIVIRVYQSSSEFEI